jgi:hypothetical protein
VCLHTFCLYTALPIRSSYDKHLLVFSASSFANHFIFLAVSASEEAAYKRIIDGLLAVADLNTVTRKKIREGLESALGRDLSAQKVRAGNRLPFCDKFALCYEHDLLLC